MVMNSFDHDSLTLIATIFESFELKVHYPPCNKMINWHAMQASTNHIKRAIDRFNWKAVFMVACVVNTKLFFLWTNFTIIR